jgi:glycosyltransferase involved in cell wall biosynthesis
LDITLVICTRNRARSLGRTLESIARAHRPAAEWEVLVVDNGSEDDTQDVVRRFVDRLPIRSCIEPTAGLSVARNRGVAEARGRYLIWTDDDVLVDRGWLQAYADAFHRWPHAAFFGGSATAILEGPSPAWFIAARNDLADLLAIRDFGETGDLIDDDTMPYGLNFATRADVQRRYLFDVELGVAPGRRRGGEELDLFERMMASGLRGRWVGSARVAHVIPSERQNHAYVRDYYHAAGQDLVLRYRPGGVLPMAASMHSAIKTVLSWPLARLAPRHPAGVRALVRLAFHSGMLSARRPPSRKGTAPATAIAARPILNLFRAKTG